MEKITITLTTLLSVALLASTAQGQTLVPKWSNTAVFGANQQYVNDRAYTD